MDFEKRELPEVVGHTTETTNRANRLELSIVL